MNKYVKMPSRIIPLGIKLLKAVDALTRFPFSNRNSSPSQMHLTPGARADNHLEFSHYKEFNKLINTIP
jgi:hypothetical protein